MILGIDLSTTRTGLCVLDKEENLLLSDVVKFDSKKPLEERASVLEKYFLSLKKEYDIEKIYLEEPFVAVGGGGGSAFTTSIVHTFSGMCRFIVYKVFKKEAILLNVRTIRSKFGIKIPRGIQKREVKQIIIDFVKSKYGDLFEYKLTHKGNFEPGTDDKADSILIGLGGLKFFP